MQLPVVKSMNNYLCEIQSNENMEHNFVYNESGPTNKHSMYPMQGHPIPPNIGSFKIWYRPTESWLGGLQLYDREGKLVFESAWKKCFANKRYKFVKTDL